ACGRAWELRAESRGKLNRGRLVSAFDRAARDQYQYIWDHSAPEERRALCDLVHGARAAGGGGGGPAAGGERGGGGGGGPRGRGGPGSAGGRRAPPRGGPRAPAGAPPPAARARTPSPAAGRPAARVALVVGVDQYRLTRSGRFFLPQLCYAAQDAVAMGALLR